MTIQVYERVARRERAEDHWLRDAHHAVGAKWQPQPDDQTRGRVVISRPESADRGHTYTVANANRSSRRRVRHPESLAGEQEHAQSHPHDHWGARSAGYSYARWQMSQIQRHADEAGTASPDPAVARRMLHHLRSLLSADALYPTLSVDEDGDLTAEWRVLDFGVELIVTPANAFWVLRQRGARRVTSDQMSVLRSVLDVLTDLADEVNPGWRSLFPKAELLSP